MEMGREQPSFLFLQAYDLGYGFGFILGSKGSQPHNAGFRLSFYYFIYIL